MGCSSSSTQTVAQENRPGIKPEEANGDTGFVAGNGIVAEDAETIADQMQLPVQSALPEDLGLGPGDTETSAAGEALQSVELVGELEAEQTATVSKMESDLIQPEEGPESSTLDELAVRPETPTPQNESSPAEIIVSQDVVVVGASVEESGLAEPAPLAEVFPTDEVPTMEPAILFEATQPASSEIPEAPPTPEAPLAPEDPPATDNTPTTDNTPAPDNTPVPEGSPALEDTPVVETITDPKQTPAEDHTTALGFIPSVESSVSTEPNTESFLVPEPIPVAESALATESTQAPMQDPGVESTPAPDPTPTENSVVAERAPSAFDEAAAIQPQIELDPQQPVQVEATAAAAAAEAVLQAAQERAFAASNANEDTTEQHVMTVLEAFDGGMGGGAALPPETEEAKTGVALARSDMAAANEE